MIRKILTLLLAISMIIQPRASYAQNCGFTKQELEQFGPWICPENLPPGYKPSPGFPGNPNPILLPEVTITGTKGIPTYFPLYPQQGVPFPTVFRPTYDSTKGNKPLPGDPLKCPVIAPSNTSGNYAGGMYGRTRTYPNGSPKMHYGYDIAAVPGTDLFSMYDGVVTDMVGIYPPGSKGKTERSYGNTITVRTTINGQTYYFMYAHLDGIAPSVKVGETVVQGQFIGQTGSTGNAHNVPNKHVHIEVWDKDKKKLDPKDFFKSKFDPKTGKNDTCK